MVWIIFGQNDLIAKKGLDSCHVGYCIGIIFIFFDFIHDVEDFLAIKLSWPKELMTKRARIHVVCTLLHFY